MAVEKAHLPNLAVAGSHFSTVGSNLAQALSTIKSSMGEEEEEEEDVMYIGQAQVSRCTY